MASPSGPTNLGVAPNVGGLLCYFPCCVGLIFSIVVAIVEKQSRFLRFHAFQSLLFHAALIVVSIGVWFVTVLLSFVSSALGFLATMLFGLVGLGMFVVAVLLMIKAYNGEQYELPAIGEMARKWA